MNKNYTLLKTSEPQFWCSNWHGL